MNADRAPRIRLTGLPDEGLLVVRGDELDPQLLAEDASRFHERYSDWNRFGVSAFLAASSDEVDALCQVRLSRFPTVLVFQRADLEAAGVDIVPTFRTPHVTLCHQRLEDLLTRLLNCPHVVRVNSYHVAE